MNDSGGIQETAPERAHETPVRSRASEIVKEPRPRRMRLQSYSRFVQWMKIILPTTAVLILILVMAWPHFQFKDKKFRIGFASLKLVAGQDKNMINPRYLGTDENAKPFSITADIAKNVIADASVVELEMPKADMTLRDGSWIVLTANTGVYNKERKSLALRNKVNLFHDSGYEFRTSAANIDMTKGLAEGDQPVMGQGPFGSLKSEGFRLIDKGRIIQFTGKAKLIMYPDIEKTLKKKPAAP